MERWQKYLIVGLATFVAGFGVFSIGYTVGRDGDGFIIGGSSSTEGADLVQEAYDKILATSVDPPTPDQLARAAIKGMIKSLKKTNDPYAFFYSPEGYRDFQELTTGKFSGIGIWLRERDGELQVVSVLPDTPALEAGLQRGDVITAIDGKAVKNMASDDAVGMIKGPEGSIVDLDIDRDGTQISFSIKRAQIDLPNLQARLTDEDLGYIRLFGFARNAGNQVHDEIDELIDKGAEGIILDLRDNGGGLFTEGISVASAFIENGTVVTYRDRSTGDIDYEAEGDAFEDIPLVVLVNQGTASASEIVAGALQDRDRAVIVGMTTYGKGSVQEVVPLSDASAVKFTTAAYLTPDGRNINGKGIEPDVRVQPGPASGPDLQLARASEILMGLVLSESGAPDSG